MQLIHSILRPHSSRSIYTRLADGSVSQEQSIMGDVLLFFHQLQAVLLQWSTFCSNNALMMHCSWWPWDIFVLWTSSSHWLASHTSICSSESSDFVAGSSYRSSFALLLLVSPVSVRRVSAALWRLCALPSWPPALFSSPPASSWTAQLYWDLVGWKDTLTSVNMHVDVVRSFEGRAGFDTHSGSHPQTPNSPLFPSLPRPPHPTLLQPEEDKI